MGLLVSALACHATEGDQLQQGQQGVLVIYSDARIQPAFVTIDEAIRSALSPRSNLQLAYYNEFIDSTRFPQPAQLERFAEYIAEKYRNTRLDAVICVRDSAFTFVMRHRASIAPRAPVIHVMVAPELVAATNPPDDVTGIVMETDTAPLLSLVRRLHPHADLVVVAGTSDLDRQWLASFQRELAGRPVRWLVGLPLEQILSEVAALPKNCVVLSAYFASDNTGRAYVPVEAKRRICLASSVPCYGTYSTSIGEGPIGGSVFDIAPVGIAAGNAALRLLAGEHPKDLHLPPLRPDVVMMDWRQLRRWGVPESALPPGSKVLFRDPSFWERYRDWIFLVAAVLAFQTSLIIALLVSRRRLGRARTHLLDGEQRLGLATEAAKLGLWVWDIPGNDIWGTEGCRRLLGIGVGEHFDLNRFLACLHDDDRAKTEATMRGGLDSVVDYEHEFRVVLPEGSLRWFAGRGRVERDGMGRARRMLGVFLDISERKRMEGDVERHRTELAHLSRVTSLGELSSSIAHELNQPLTAILSNAQAALRYLERPEPDLVEVREILSDIARQDQRAGDVIRRMRAMLRKDGTQMGALDLRQVVDEVLSMMRSDLIARNVTCMAEMGESPVMVLGDRVQLQQVLINLVSNACDAMASQPPERRRLVAAITDHGTDVHCEVIDHGHGITDHERIFDPFFSTKPHGIGMGLAICRSIATVHRGSLTAHDNPAGGAALRLRLPTFTGTHP